MRQKSERISPIWVGGYHPFSAFLVGINFPMATITTTHISNVWHFCNMALDCSKSLFTHFGQFLCCNLRILSDLVFYPFIKIFFLSATLSAILSAILSVTLVITLYWSHKCYHNKATIDRPCRCSYTSLLASLHDAFHTRTPRSQYRLYYTVH